MKIENVLNALVDMDEQCENYPYAAIKIMDSEYKVTFIEGMFRGEKIGSCGFLLFTKEAIPEGTEFQHWCFNYPRLIDIAGIDSDLLIEEIEAEVEKLRDTLNQAIKIIQKYEQMEYEE